MKTAFVLVNSEHGAMIINRFDYNTSYEDKWYGIGAELLETGAFATGETLVLKQLLGERRKYRGDGVVVLDCGANIGIFSVEIAKYIAGWGQLLALEPQERLFYALAGNLVLHNCSNARARWLAVDAEEGLIDFPEPDYAAPGSFGSFELRQTLETLGTENIGQNINYDKPTSRVRCVKIDTCGLERVDLIKLDIEGMELDALKGAVETLKRDQPIIFVEVAKVDREDVENLLKPLGYKLFAHDVMNVLAVHLEDPVINSIQVVEKTAL
jgi:FkbM family methyltransferase